MNTAAFKHREEEFTTQSLKDFRVRMPSEEFAGGRALAMKTRKGIRRAVIAGTGGALILAAVGFCNLTTFYERTSYTLLGSMDRTLAQVRQRSAIMDGRAVRMDGLSMNPGVRYEVDNVRFVEVEQIINTYNRAMRGMGILPSPSAKIEWRIGVGVSRAELSADAKIRRILANAMRKGM